MVQICTPQLGPKNKSIETEIKTGEHRSIATKFKSSQLTEAIEARVSILYVIENDEVLVKGGLCTTGCDERELCVGMYTLMCSFISGVSQKKSQ
jgi:hypothetical protein